MPFTEQELAEIAAADEQLSFLPPMTLDEYRLSRELDREAKLQVMEPRKRANLVHKQKRYPLIAEQQREYSRNYNREHAAEKAEYNRQWKEDNREQVAAYNAAWRATNRERVAAYNREYAQSHPRPPVTQEERNRRNARRRELYARNPEKYRQRNRDCKKRRREHERGNGEDPTYRNQE